MSKLFKKTKFNGLGLVTAEVDRFSTPTPIISIQKMVSGHIIKRSVKRKRFHFQMAENRI